MDTLKILVVDDEAGMRRGAERALRDFTVQVPEVNGEVRFEVDQAESGEQALDIIGADPPHIMLLDHKMGGISGLDVLDRVGDQDLDMLTIMITAYASIETAIRATKSGAYDFLAKPFTPGELKNAIRKAAEHVIVTRQARKLAREKRQVRFQFISVLAHELKAPINAVDGYLNVLKDRTIGQDEAAYDEVIGRCQTRIEFMRKMIADLLDLTRIESGQKRRDVTDVDVAAIARTAVDAALPAAAEEHVTILLHAEGPVPMQADAGEIEIILNNLITNAVKYNREGGSADVTVRREKDAVVIQVADTGIGMTHEEAARLFEDFVRIKNEKTRDIFGSGLGLSIVKKLAHLYGGSVSVTSAPGVGSTFTVTLPAN